MSHVVALMPVAANLKRRRAHMASFDCATAGVRSLSLPAAAENAKRQTRHDFKAEYVQIAANKGNTEVLRQLLADYDIPWTAAQVEFTAVSAV
jgi:hypothetical protein